jgi:hypothetical protein
MRPRCRAAWPKLSTVVLLLLTSCACAKTEGARKDAPEVPPRKRAEVAELFAGYKGWTRVNPEPAVFHSHIASQCAMPSPEQRRLEGENPHRDKYVTVYVNDAGRRAMLEEMRPRFPAGTLIVKEKLPARDAEEPELLTAMLKHESGYDPEGGDWEYFVLDGRGREVRARGRLESCRACHQAYPHTDFVSRNYLPYHLRQKLK